MGFSKILIGVDFTEVTGTALSMGSELAQKFGASVRLLHTEPPISGYVYYTPGIGFDNLIGFGMESTIGQASESIQIEHDKQALEAIQKQFVAHKIPTQISLLTGEAAPTILNEAENFGADLIIIAGHSHGVFYRLMFGSVENQLIRDSRIPVLVVPSHNKSN